MQNNKNNNKKTRQAKPWWINRSGTSTHPLTFDISCSIQELGRYLITNQLFIFYIGGEGGAGGGAANWEDDPPLIIGRCQSLHNTENSAPSHAEHPRSLSSWLSTHGFSCAHRRKSKRRGVVKFILEVQVQRPLRSDRTTSRCFRCASVPQLCVSSGFSCRVHFTHSRPPMWRRRRDISEGTIPYFYF